MTRNQLRVLDRELSAYLDEMVADMGRPERRHAMGLYLTGLLLDGERKSTQPMAIRLAKDGAEAEALRQRLQQCVSISSWSEAELFRRLAVKLGRTGIRWKRNQPGLASYRHQRPELEGVGNRFACS